MNIFNRQYARSDLLRRIGNINQIGGTRHYELTEGSTRGVRVIDADTGSGFNFSVIPDRGMDISQASYKGINLVYQTPNGEVNPAFYDAKGSEWLRVFFAGLVTTCGLTYFGPPGIDEGITLGLHGRHSSIPAKKVCDLSRWEFDEYVIEITGSIEDSILFGDKLNMRRSIKTNIGAKSVKIHDIIENCGPMPSPLTILYHINAGFPLIDEGSRLISSSREVDPYDASTGSQTAQDDDFTGPIAGFTEQNYLHKMAGDEEGYAYAAVINRQLMGGIGLFVRFKTDTLPYLSEWKMMGEGDYVLGIEPCNVRCENRGLLREKGMLPFLQPREQRETELEIGVLDGLDEIKIFEDKVSYIKSTAR
jgi:hypothetical protein